MKLRIFIFLPPCKSCWLCIRQGFWRRLGGLQKVHWHVRISCEVIASSLQKGKDDLVRETNKYKQKQEAESKKKTKKVWESWAEKIDGISNSGRGHASWWWPFGFSCFGMASLQWCYPTSSLQRSAACWCWHYVDGLSWITLVASSVRSKTPSPFSQTSSSRGWRRLGKPWRNTMWTHAMLLLCEGSEGVLIFQILKSYWALQ